MTRSFGWLAHGHLHQSLRYHPLAPLFLVEGVIAAAFLLYRRRAQRDSPTQPSELLQSAGLGRLRPSTERVVLNGVLLANAMLLFVVWVIRLKLGSFDDLG
jgi:hypothetical protein